ncbi:hypothetical protein M513_04389 [Trichuris suis]|uniref:Uncharacterized protein n=1 Tax=Trichuris suis TaxID=68888 RepID=A0A085MBU3_9BILA|nr:hypothetical protein M513_04389 [Trichuris suis]
MDVRDIEEFINSAPEELTEDDLLEMTGPEMLPGDDDEDLEEAVQENKLTLENLAKGFWRMESRNRINSSTRRITFATVAGDGRTEVFLAKCHRAHLIAPRQDQADGLP